MKKRKAYDYYEFGTPRKEEEFFNTSYGLLKEVLQERGEILHSQYFNAILTAVYLHRFEGLKMCESSERSAKEYQLHGCERGIRHYMELIYAKQTKAKK